MTVRRFPLSFRTRRFATALGLATGVSLLGACAAPPEVTAEGLRPGISSGADYDRARLRPGQSARYAFTLPRNLPSEAGVSITSTYRTSAGASGNINFVSEAALTLPFGDLEEVASRMLPPEADLPFELRGNAIVFKGSGIQDRKGRGLTMRTLRTQADFAPHDCMGVLGTCTSTLSVPSTGQTLSVIVETTEAGGFWFAEVRLDPAKMRGANKLISRSVFSLDRNLILIDSKTITYDKRPYEPVVVRRVR